MHTAYIGNFVPTHSTENHMKIALEYNGHTVDPIQENNPREWKRATESMSDYDLVLWTTTHPFAQALGPEPQVRMLAAARKAGVKTVGFHLDRWHGLDRERDLYVSPFFRCDLVVTAFGGADWEDIGVNHLWLPPAVSLPETELGKRDPKYTKTVVFVGTWRGYHQEWPHRAYLIQFLKENFPRETFLWPRPGQPSIRGEELRNLYASSQIVIGDSCLSGGATHYWSDRIPETVGRGGFLIHPHVVGLDEHFTPGKHLVTWEAFDWDTLHALIVKYRDSPDEARRIALDGRDHVREYHTYEVRVKQILEAVEAL